MIGGESIDAGAAKLIGKSGHLSLDFMYQYVYNFAINITFTCRPKVQVLLDWRLQVWNQIRQAAEEQYNKSLQNYRTQQAEARPADRRLRRAHAAPHGAGGDHEGRAALAARARSSTSCRSISRACSAPTANDPERSDVLDPNRLTDAEWLDVMEHGEFIKYLHNAIEWENVLYFTYPYFWDDNSALGLQEVPLPPRSDAPHVPARRARRASC